MSLPFIYYRYCSLSAFVTALADVSDVINAFVESDNILYFVIIIALGGRCYEDNKED